MTRNMVWDVVVVGSANTDFLIRGPKLPAKPSSAMSSTRAPAARTLIARMRRDQAKRREDHSCKSPS